MNKLIERLERDGHSGDFILQLIELGYDMAEEVESENRKCILHL